MIFGEHKKENRRQENDILSRTSDFFGDIYQDISEFSSDIKKLSSCVSEKIKKIPDILTKEGVRQKEYIRLLEKIESSLEVSLTKLDSCWYGNQDEPELFDLRNKLSKLKEKVEIKKTKEILQEAGPKYEKVWNILQSGEYEHLQDLKISRLRNNEVDIANFEPIFLRNGDIDLTVSIPTSEDSEYIDRVLQNRNKLIEIIKSRLNEKGVNIGEIDSDFLKFFAFLHEVGHANDFATKEQESSYNEKEYKDSLIKQCEELPFKSHMMRPEIFLRQVDKFGWRKLLEQSDDPEEVWGDILDNLDNKFEINDDYEEAIKNTSNPDELLNLIDKVYKSLDSEEAADEFATNFIAEYYEEIFSNT